MSVIYGRATLFDESAEKKARYLLSLRKGDVLNPLSFKQCKQWSLSYSSEFAQYGIIYEDSSGSNVIWNNTLGFSLVE